MPRVFLAMLALAALAGGPATAAARTPSLQEAASAYFQMQVPQSEAMFKAILDDPAAPAGDKAGAARGLARIQWLMDADAKGAEATLDRGVAAGADLCRTTGFYVRVLREAGEAEAGARMAERRAGDCPGAAQGDRLLIERGKADLAWAAAAGADGAPRDAALADARAALAGISKVGLLAPDAARLKLGLALQRADADAALGAWRDFFWLTDHNAPASFRTDDAAVAALFAGALGPTARLADEVGLERLLIRGGFLDEALRFDAHRRVAERVAERAAGDPAYRPVALYFAFRRRFDAATLSFNRAYAHGHRDTAAYYAEVTRILADTAAGVGGGDPKSALREAYGLHWMIGATGGVASVHMGHVVDDTRYKVDQFGRQGDLAFLSIDNMVSNGYQSWLWDGIAATGGWSEGAGIVQIRASYTPSALEALASFDPVVARRDAAEMASLEARDAEALKSRPVAFLPALQRRLTRQGRDQVAARARVQAQRTGEPYERTFVKVYWDAMVGHSISIHEGRHALDHIQFHGPATLTSAELEFRAKLSELELADLPRMPLAVILSADIGDQTPHGVADTRIMEGLGAWIAAHPREVSGYDPKVPAAQQIDKLTDAQIRAIAHRLDPQFAPPKPAKAQSLSASGSQSISSTRRAACQSSMVGVPCSHRSSAWSTAAASSGASSQAPSRIWRRLSTR